MTPDLNGFSRYSLIGAANTFIHWLVVAALCVVMDVRQSVGNLTGFIVAGSFSFVINGRYTFKNPLSWQRYWLFMVFMGGLSVAVGHMADLTDKPPLLAAMVFSSLSLTLGYCYSKYMVFRS